MPKKTLTELTIKALKPPARGQETTWDTHLIGFGVRCSQGGAKTFVVMHGKTRRRETIGRYPLVSLGDARKRAREILLQAVLHPDRPASPPFQVALDRYLTLREPELRAGTFVEYRRLLNKYFAFGETPVGDLSTTEVADTIDRIERPGERTHAYLALKVFFNWCVEREYCKANPLASVRRPKVPSARERVLSDDELTAVWNAADGLGKYGTIVRLLMVTGQRRRQVACLHRSWIDYDRKVIAFPARIMKNNRDHVLPFGTLTEYLLRSVTDDQGYLFSPAGLAGHPFTAWSKNKRALDGRLDEMDAWTLHDLRRTWSTNAARLDIAPHVTDRVLSHVTGSLSPIARIYNRFRYETETRDAVRRMESHILQLVT
ncbi:MAG: tyrosine-type recombinase/integrase [Pirellulaceae bacterium]